MILEIEHIWSGIADQKFKFCYYLFILYIVVY